MKSLVKWMLALAIGVLAAGVATAQPPRGGFGFGGTGPLGLSINKDVLTDIKATDEQKSKLAEWQKEAQPKFGEALQEKLADVAPEERFQKMAAVMADLNKGLWKDIYGVLKPEQVTRMRQIALQAMGVRAFADKDTVEKLKLTDDQKEKVKTILEEMQSAQMELFQNSGFTPGEAPDQEKMAAFQKKQTDLSTKTFAKAKDVLKDDQKKTWAEMTGKEFDVAKLRTGFGGRRGGL